MSSTTNNADPFAEQREMYDLLSQETRHLILQYILAHPSHLVSLDEFAYLMPKNKAAIRDQLQRLQEESIVEQYDHLPNEDSRDLPSQFYGFTERGVDILDEYNYLRGLPLARALYDNTRLSEKAIRHRDAPRPHLPDVISQALQIENRPSINRSTIARFLREQSPRSPSLEAQVDVVTLLYEEGVGPDHDGVSRSALADLLEQELEYALDTVITHLLEADILERVDQPGPDFFAIDEQSGEIVLGRVEEKAEENLDALIQDIDDELQAIEIGEIKSDLLSRKVEDHAPVAQADGAGRTVRSILASSFGIDPEEVIGYLRSGEPIERLNSAIDAIESSQEVEQAGEYGNILFRRRAHRYRLTKRALELF